MESLKQKILDEGQPMDSKTVKVDRFLNHQIDVAFMDQMGEEFGRKFAETPVDKILTVEASGIAIACMAAPYFGFPRVVFAKKAAPSTMTEDFYGAEAKSFTKGTVSVVRVAKKYLNPGERVLIIDDFLAHGEAAMALTQLVEQAGAQVVGIGVVIEKAFQGGGQRLVDAGYRCESLVSITKIENGQIIFK